MATPGRGRGRRSMTPPPTPKRVPALAGRGRSRSAPEASWAQIPTPPASYTLSYHTPPNPPPLPPLPPAAPAVHVHKQPTYDLTEEMAGLNITGNKKKKRLVGTASDPEMSLKHERADLRDLQRLKAAEKSRQARFDAVSFSQNDPWSLKDFHDKQEGTFDDFTTYHVTEGKSFNAVIHKLYELGYPLETNDWSEFTILGEGGFGQVFKGRRRMEPQDSVAIKMMDMRHKKKKTPAGENEMVKRTDEEIKRYKIGIGSEIQMLCRISKARSLHIVQLIDHFIIDESVFVILEYSNSQTLYEYLHPRGIFPPDFGLNENQIRWWFKQLVTGLEAIHRMQIVHRDLKLANILVHRTLWMKKTVSFLKICDFGLARDLTPGPFIETVAGTFSYHAPEVLTAYCDNYGFKKIPRTKYLAKPIDIWALGLILYEMIYRDRPWVVDKTSYKTITKSINSMKTMTNLSQPIPGITTDLNDILMACWTWNPEHRVTIGLIRQFPWMQQPNPWAVNEPTLEYYSRKFPQK